MTDDTDELPTVRAVAGDIESVSWPLVERRSSHRTPPGGIDRRSLATDPAASATTPTLSAAPLWPFRLAALAGAFLRAQPELSVHNWSLTALTAAATVFTAVTCRRPVAYRNDPKIRLRIVVELACVTAAVLLSGAWASPFVLFLVPLGMLAGFAAGGVFSAQLAAAAVAVVTVQHVPNVGVRQGLQDGALWVGLLGLVAFTSGLAHRAAYDAARQQQVALDRVSRLAEANSLLFALQRVAQTLPASLDLEEVLDSTVGRLRTMVRHDLLAVYLVDLSTRRATPARTHGIDLASSYPLERLPPGLRQAVDSPKTIRIDDIPEGDSISPGARCGLYAALRARGALIGFIALEAASPGTFGQQQAEVVHGLTEPFGIAIDNARMFRRIRTMAADEERSRIARELHDHVGSSLAMIGFEIDRALSVAGEGGGTEPLLRELREQVSAVVRDVRDTLFDLRTDITDARDLTVTATDFLQAVGQRSGLDTRIDIRTGERLPLPMERELWQIIREAIVNAERHARAGRLAVFGRQTGTTVLWAVRDDGVGLDAAGARPDSYGLVGMRERAHRLGATLTVQSLREGGTEVRIELPTEGRIR
ncbi:MAG: histidine kinase [Ilumatobacteraceae bacterium]